VKKDLIKKTYGVIALALLVLLLANGGFAAVCASQTPASTVSVTGTLSGVCANFAWTRSNAATYASMDFNNYIVTVTSNLGSDLSTGDFNTNSTSYKACPIDSGETVTINVMSYDGNKLGHYCSNDANTSVRIGTTTGSVQYLVYQIFTGIGGIILLLILSIIAIMILAKFNIGKAIKM